MVLASELSEYLPVVILAALAFLFAVLSLAVSALLRPNRPTPAKLAPYECGIEPERLPRASGSASASTSSRCCSSSSTSR